MEFSIEIPSLLHVDLKLLTYYLCLRENGKGDKEKEDLFVHCVSHVDLFFVV